MGPPALTTLSTAKPTQHPQLDVHSFTATPTPKISKLLSDPSLGSGDHLLAEQKLPGV